MASEDMRAMLAEYAAAGEDDDEADFDPDRDSDDDDGASEDGGSSSEEEGAPRDHAVLTGSIHLNDEGRVIYSGTWCMKSELDGEEDDVGAEDAEGTARRKATRRKRHPKFKLKSQGACHAAGGGDGNGNGGGRRGALFDVRRPTLAKLPPPGSAGGNDDGEEVPLPTRRTMIFDGFFFEHPPAADAADSATPPDDGDGPGRHRHHHPQGRKIKERDVEIFFTTAAPENGEGGREDRTPGRPATGAAHRISGRGHNEHGPFVLDGTYAPAPGNGGGAGPSATAVCVKTYGAGGASKATRPDGVGAAKGPAEGTSAGRARRSRRLDDDEDFGDEGAEFGEVAELHVDATMSIDELRRKYYGGGEAEAVGDGGGKAGAAAKRPRLEESDDDECGF